MARGAGRFRDRAVFEVRSGTGDAYGNPDTVWSDYETRRVEVVEAPGTEALEGGVVQSHTRAVIKVRKDRRMMVLPTDARVLLRERYWSVHSIADLTPRELNVLQITLDSGATT